MQHGTGSATQPRGAASSSRTRSTPRHAARAVHRVRRMGDEQPQAAGKPGAEAEGWNAGAAAAQEGMGFPNIPSPFADTRAVTYTGLKTTRYHFDYGLNFYETGIMTINPPIAFPFDTPSATRTIRRTARSIRAISRRPTATAMKSPACGCRTCACRSRPTPGGRCARGVWANDGCEAAGQFIPFAGTEADARGDGRSASVGRGALPNLRRVPRRCARRSNDLVTERFLLCEDAQSEETRMVRRRRYARRSRRAGNAAYARDSARVPAEQA